MTKYILYLLTIFSITGCSRSFNKEEAVRSLKVLNSDLTQFFMESEELPEMEVFSMLWSDSTTPLPFPNEKFTFAQPYREYDFQSSKGEYHQDSIQQKFIRVDDHESVAIKVSTSRHKECLFELVDYKTEEISSRPSFPVIAKANLFADSQLLLSISHEAQIVDDLPLFINTLIEGINYDLNFDFNRTRIGNHGTIIAKSSMKFEEQEIIDLEFDSEIGYSTMGYFFEKINFRLAMFHHLITAKINYDLIDPTSSDYIKSFNQNSKIEIFERPYGKKVGNIRLGSTHNGELSDYFIEFGNGDTALLSEYIPGLQKILNVKL